MQRRIPSAIFAVLTSACTVDVAAIVSGDDEVGETSVDDGSPIDTDEDSEEGELDTAEGADGADEGPSDLPAAPAPQPWCTVPDDELAGPLPCDLPEPSTILDPVVAWTWPGVGTQNSVLTTPLVANLDDDDHDGFVTLCDSPDIVVAAVDLPPTKEAVWPLGHLHVIDGASGELRRSFSHPIDAAINPAIADLDADGRPEVIALEPSAANSPYSMTPRRLVAFDGEGNLLWTGDHWQLSRGGGALAIADLDADGSPEILAPEYVADASGQLLWALDNPPLAYSMPVAVDLDLDGELEVVFGSSAYDHDGELLFSLPNIASNRGTVAVADFDDDPYPELYVQEMVHMVVEHDGSIKAVCPTNDEVATAGHPVAVRDLDADGSAEIVFGFTERVYVLGVEGETCFLKWSKKIDALEARSSGTMFDLLGDGTAETIYTDRTSLRVFGPNGVLLFEHPRSARDEIANPVVADVDNDGAAEIVMVSSEPLPDTGEATPQTPTLTVLENLDDGLVSTRRLWNQHTYHHSNLAEDGSVPIGETPHWLSDNGFRTNVWSKASDSCIPAP